MNLNIIKVYLISAVFLLLGACESMAQETRFSGETMGTTYMVKIVGNSNITQQKIDDRLKQINQIFSTWDADSELSLLNKKPINRWIPVSEELFYVLKISNEIHQQTYEYFDPGLGRLIDVWGFGVKKVVKKPSQEEVYQAFKSSSIHYLRLKDDGAKWLQKTRDIHINLSAIAKGYAVDEIAKLLNTPNYLVEIGGEVRTGGNNHDKAWTVGIEQPNASNPIALRLNNQSIATSGNYRNYSTWQGERYMHILDPNNGLPANSDLASVSVIHPETIAADAYATAMMAMGSKQATLLAEQLKLPVILILDVQNNFKILRINL